ncbi:MAG: type I-C CRISPR-associated protein Cas5 [Thermogutta sp.]|nr:type I-C CRISPR-associated protein Cas5 [Thermogutta sp.]
MAAARRHTLEVWGDFACFTRPEMKVERYSYPCPTPSAARGIFEAVYFKPQFRWQVDRIEILSEIAYIGLRRNETKEKISEAAVKKWARGTAEPEPILADGDADVTGSAGKGRTQRQTTALRNPRFRITAHIVPRPGYEDQQAAYDAQFLRRASQGKCFYQPALGCREFAAFFKLLEEDAEAPPPPLDYTEDLGWMVYDVFDLDRVNDCSAPPFITLFRAKIEHGVLEVPPYDSPEVRKPVIA